MPAKLYVVHGSHPCRTVEQALQMKAIAYDTVELPPPSHALVMRALFGKRTVPAIKLEDGTKLSGSRAILARLDELVPEPSLLPADEARRAEVLEAERWGDEVLQALVRRVLWPTLTQHPKKASGFSEGGKIPLPDPVLRASMPLIGRIEQKMNATSLAIRDQDLRALPAHLDRIDLWISEGVLGGDPPNRADLQIAPSIALLMVMQDLRDVIAPRPCGQLADRLFPGTAGTIERGALPSELVSAMKPATSSASTSG